MTYTKTQTIRQERRKTAEDRNAKYAALTLEEKIARQEAFKGKQYDKLVAMRDGKKAKK